MNIGIVLNQQPIRQSTHHSTKQDNGGSFANLFDNMAAKQKQLTLASDQGTSIRSTLASSEKSLERFAELTQLPEKDLVNLLESFGIDSEKIQSLLTSIDKDSTNSVDAKEAMASLLENLPEEQAIMLQMLSVSMQQTSKSKLPTEGMHVENLTINVTSNTGKTEQSVSLEKATQMWNQIKDVLKQVVSGASSNDFSAKLLKSLEQWSALMKNAPNVAANVLSQDKNSTEAKLWDRLMHAYQNRMDGAVRSYQSAKVTITDVSKWVQNAMSKMSNEAKDVTTNTNHASMSSVSGQAISKVEQFVIHMNQSATTDQKAMQNELIEKFQNILKSSQFMSKANGSNELLLKLNPKQLGDITVRLIQQNGEMLVKLITTTQAAKDALEGNIQQLRHMFSPQQVVIEKQDAQNFQMSHQDTSDNFEDQLGHSSGQTNSDNQDAENSDDTNQEESQSFADILWNEKV
ncbi:hypothetical protein Pryu01_00131 [Paraliobacillus ryukyuensis]|uniref:Flagellar hook-length control protein FliK n=1 Tax=Paraliobacillus ryukyuensis TaxID=200904 RepID=A0A366EHC0_9BACI|nr:flagellar hook-length control protein FliK [Paraliobacillus ryukyuensis]RBP01797.1 flagellar hook-length control protein FliK [Paraliobacillus ryukyuensis]